MQRYRGIILIIVFGIVPVVGAFLFALTFLQRDAERAAPTEAVTVRPEAPPPEKPPEMREVLVAARDLPVGTLIGAEHLTTRAIEATSVRAGYTVVGEDPDPHALRGHAVREAISSGEPVSRSSTIAPGQPGFLAAVLGPGMRAVTISPGEATRQAGLLDAGDRVDVILSADIQASDGTRSNLSRTILEDVRVLAINNRLGTPLPPGEAGGESGSRPERGEARTVTLEVSPEQGTRLAHGDREGTLSLAVRSLVAGGPRRPDLAVDLHDLLIAPPSTGPAVAEARAVHRFRKADEEPPSRTVWIIRGSESAEEVLFQGAPVAARLRARAADPAPDRVPLRPGEASPPDRTMPSGVEQ